MNRACMRASGLKLRLFSLFPIPYFTSTPAAT